MKALKLIFLFLICILFLVTCKTNHQLIERADSVYIQKLIPVTLPADSSMVKALLKCDSSGSVLLSKLHIESSKNARLSFILDSMGNLQVKTILKHDTLYLPSDSVRITTVLTQTEYIEKQLGK